LRLWRSATCGADCGAGSMLGLFSDALTGGAFLALALACPRALRWLLALLWTLFQVGSQELFHAMQRYPVWQDLHYLFDADFVRNSTGSFKLAAPLFTAVLFLSAIAASLVRLPKVRLRHLAWAVPALAVLFFAHARLEAGSNHAVTANRNPVHNFVLDAAHGSWRSSKSTAAALPESLKHADLSGAPLLAESRGKAKNVLIVVIEGIPGLYIPEIRQAMGIQEHSLTMEKLTESTKDAMLIPDFTAHSHQTIRGLYAILCGDFSKLSFDTPKAFELLSKPERAAACLPAQLAQHGFSTHYLQAAGLGFMAKDRAMAQMGFGEVHGMEWFAEQKISNPFPFDWGVADSAFFLGARRYISELRKSEQPWMLTLLTVGTHHPFGISDAMAANYPSRQEAAVMALDEAVAAFLHQLKADGVMEDTLVIVTSDESHGAPRWDWVSSWGLHMVFAPEQAALPRIKQGGYGLLDVEASVLDYLGLAAPPAIIGRSYFRDYDTPREMFSFTNMVLRRHTGNTGIRCAGGRTCVEGQAPSILSRPPQDVRELPPHLSAETYAMAASLDNALRPKNDVRQFSFASGEQRRLKRFSDSGTHSNVLTGGQYLDIPANSDVTVHLQATLLEGPQDGVPFQLLAVSDRIKFGTLLESAPLPEFPDLPTLRPGESMDLPFSFHNDRKLDRLSFYLRADAEDGLVRIDRLDVTIESANTDSTVQETLSPLATAAQLGHTDRARALIERGAAVNAADKLRITALMRAAMNGHTDTVKMLLDKGASVNATTLNGQTALSIALDRGNINVAEILLARGADPNACFLLTLWHGRLDTAKLLLAHGADINHKTESDAEKRTPLMYAAYYDREDLIAFLLDHGANVNDINQDGETALSFAVAENNINMAKILLDKGADPNTALIAASRKKREDSIKFLLEHGADIKVLDAAGTAARDRQPQD
ncbi:MAG: ankyrin repeat domain-containing protein, partial [Ottowia sp.]|nr:ankyrin repeat domain-containing protein [Ottowia sp.]